jgi:hypothetical protein
MNPSSSKELDYKRSTMANKKTHNNLISVNEILLILNHDDQNTELELNSTQIAPNTNSNDNKQASIASLQRRSQTCVTDTTEISSNKRTMNPKSSLKRMSFVNSHPSRITSDLDCLSGIDENIKSSVSPKSSFKNDYLDITTSKWLPVKLKEKIEIIMNSDTPKAHKINSAGPKDHCKKPLSLQNSLDCSNSKLIKVGKQLSLKYF